MFLCLRMCIYCMHETLGFRMAHGLNNVGGGFGDGYASSEIADETSKTDAPNVYHEAIPDCVSASIFFDLQ